MSTRILTWVLLLAVLCDVATAKTSRQERASLKGVGPIWVVVEDLPADVKSSGVTDDSLQTQVELNLRRARIRVTTEQAYGKAAGVRGVLGVSVMIRKCSSAPIWFGAISVVLSQVVTLQSGAPSPAVTWQNRSIFVLGNDRLLTLPKFLQPHIDSFVNDYLAANPKK